MKLITINYRKHIEFSKKSFILLELYSIIVVIVYEWDWGVTMAKCPFLTTYEEEIECFKECSLYKWNENENKCPFVELKNFKSVVKKNIYDYDLFRDDKSSPISILYSENYV